MIATEAKRSYKHIFCIDYGDLNMIRVLHGAKRGNLNVEDLKSVETYKSFFIILLMSMTIHHANNAIDSNYMFG